RFTDSATRAANSSSRSRLRAGVSLLIPRAGTGRSPKNVIALPRREDQEIPSGRPQCQIAVRLRRLQPGDAMNRHLHTAKGIQGSARLPGLAAGLGAALVLAFGIGQAQAPSMPAGVNAKRMSTADRDGANWLSYGRTYSEQRFSPLTKITADNAKQLGLAWYADLDTNRGQEATPLVIDGVLYTSTAWSLVKAYDAATGKLLWSYDPEVPKELGVEGCCDVVSRGIAAWEGKIYLATFDARLIAVDARTGKPVWSVKTGDQKHLTITQAP